MPRLAILFVSAVLCAGCSASSAPSTSSPSTSSPVAVPAKPQPFPATPAAALPAGTVHIALTGTFSMQGPSSLSADDHYVWVEGLNRIDPTTNKVVDLAGGAEADFVAAGDGSVWASDFNNNVVRRYTTAGKLVATISGISGAEGLVLTPGAVWVAAHHGGSIDRIDAVTNRITNRVPATTFGPNGVSVLTSGLGGVWGGATVTQSVSRVDIAGRRKTLNIDLSTVGGDPCGGVAITPVAGWVSSCLDETQLDQFDPRTGKLLKAKDIGAKVEGIVADGDTIWFVAGGDPDASRGPNVAGALIQLDSRWRVLHKYVIGPDFTSGGIVKAFGAIWVGNTSAPEVVRIPVS